MSDHNEKMRTLTPLPTPADVKQAMDQITALTQTDVPQVPEALFCQHVLPVLTDTTGSVDVSIWLDLAGSVHRAMDIVDVAGAVLFRVPPMMSRTPTRTDGRARDAMNTLLTEVNLKSDVNPRLGQHVLEAGLARKVPKGELDMDTAQQWNAILIRYGYTPLRGIGSKDPSAPESTVVEVKPIFSNQLPDEDF